MDKYKEYILKDLRTYLNSSYGLYVRHRTHKRLILMTRVQMIYTSYEMLLDGEY